MLGKGVVTDLGIRLKRFPEPQPALDDGCPELAEQGPPEDAQTPDGNRVEPFEFQGAFVHQALEVTDPHAVEPPGDFAEAFRPV